MDLVANSLRFVGYVVHFFVCCFMNDLLLQTFVSMLDQSTAIFRKLENLLEYFIIMIIWKLW